jgi:predicted phosphoribosyltransferase
LWWGTRSPKSWAVRLTWFISRKVGAPAQPELAVGAVAEDGAVFVDEEIAVLVGVSRDYVERRAREELRGGEAEG